MPCSLVRLNSLGDITCVVLHHKKIVTWRQIAKLGYIDHTPHKGPRVDFISRFFAPSIIHCLAGRNAGVMNIFSRLAVVAPHQQAVKVCFWPKWNGSEPKADKAVLVCSVLKNNMQINWMPV